MAKQKINTVNKTFDIVEILLQEQGCTLVELTNKMDLSKSAVLAYLNTLTERGYITKNEDGTYEASLQFLVMGGEIRRQKTIFDSVRPLMRELAFQTGESVSYNVERGGKLVYVGMQLGERAIETDVHVGLKTDLHSNTQGKMLLAHLSEPRREAIVNGLDFPLDNQKDAATFRAELKELRDKEVISGTNAIVNDVTVISAPIIDIESKVHGSITVAGPTVRFTEERIKEIENDLLYMIGDLNISLSFTDSPSTITNYISTH